MKLILIIVCCFSAFFAELTVKQSISQCVDVETQKIIADVNKLIDNCAKQGRRRKCYQVNDGKLIKQETLLLTEAQKNKCVNDAKQLVLKTTQKVENCIKNIPILTISDAEINSLNDKLLPFYEKQFADGLARCNSTDVVENGKAAIVKCLKDEFSAGSVESASMIKSTINALITLYENDVKVCAENEIKKFVADIDARIEKYSKQQLNDDMKKQCTVDIEDVIKNDINEGIKCMQNIEYFKVSNDSVMQMTSEVTAQDQTNIVAASEKICLQGDKADVESLKKDIDDAANAAGELVRTIIKKFIG